MQENWALSQNITFSCPKEAEKQEKKGTIPRLSQGFTGTLSSKMLVKPKQGPQMRSPQWICQFQDG